MKRIVVALAGLALVSCADRATIEARKAAAQAALDHQDDATCRSYGTAPGSQPYVACRMNIANNRSQAQIAADWQQQNAYQTMMSAGAAMASGNR